MVPNQRMIGGLAVPSHLLLPSSFSDTILVGLFLCPDYSRLKDLGAIGDLSMIKLV